MITYQVFIRDQGWSCRARASMRLVWTPLDNGNATTHLPLCRHFSEPGAGGTRPTRDAAGAAKSRSISYLFLVVLVVLVVLVYIY